MTSLVTRRDTIAGLAAAALSFPLRAQAHLDRPLKLVVPFSPGGTADVLPRLLGEKLRPAYPAGVVIENKPGAGGNIGADFVFRAEPDGSTLLASPPGPIAINQNLYRKLPFNPARWVPVTVIATVPNVLAVSNKVPARNVREFIAYLNSNPGRVSVASQGNGSTSHLTAAMFMQLTGTEMNHVPYRGTAPAMVDLLGGNVDVFFDNLSSSIHHHQAGKLRILAVADEQRSQILPEVPTFAEQQVPAMQAVTFFSIVAPPATPAATIATLFKQVEQSLSAPDVRKKFAEQGAEPRGWAPEESAAFIRRETEKWAKVIKTANVTLD